MISSTGKSGWSSFFLPLSVKVMEYAVEYRSPENRNRKE
jgi:hypothetical protein